MTTLVKIWFSDRFGWTIEIDRAGKHYNFHFTEGATEEMAWAAVPYAIEKAVTGKWPDDVVKIPNMAL